MNETVMERPLGAAQTNAAKKKTGRSGSGLRMYLLLGLAIAVGFLLRDLDLITPEEGVGYWLGIIGGSAMLLLLLYPLRKRIRWLHRFGATRHWFRMHMWLGLLGPLLILYHCNFQLGSFNSKVAMYCMLLVAGSGIVGRHFYSAIHKGLYGRKTSLGELQAELANSIEKSHGLANLMPTLVSRLGALSSELQGDAVVRSLGVRRSLRWTFTHVLTRISLMLTARRELRAAAEASDIVARDYQRIHAATSRYVADYTRLMGRVAQFSFYERLFALWHILHLPFFLTMVLSALVHVLAVHMY